MYYRNKQKIRLFLASCFRNVFAFVVDELPIRETGWWATNHGFTQIHQESNPCLVAHQTIMNNLAYIS
ncbi:hypothetical protein OC25_21105 [Pedobacter kyungheensis]|uniref:Uncharacterized protein n=1 Tax=Pedobacter kyungheensis TaxID=1069985 RepID=A0A0C1FIC1_9SPHI|nr:hypothetical protein OC25_21105 [Pedobacter kyungheensis]